MAKKLRQRYYIPAALEIILEQREGETKRQRDERAHAIARLFDEKVVSGGHSTPNKAILHTQWDERQDDLVDDDGINPDDR